MGALLRRVPLVVHIQVTDTDIVHHAACVWRGRLCRACIGGHMHSAGSFESGMQTVGGAVCYIVGRSDAVIVLPPRLRYWFAGDSGLHIYRVPYLANSTHPTDEPAVPGERPDGPLILLPCVGEINGRKRQPHHTRILCTINARIPTAFLGIAGPWETLNDGDRRLIERSLDTTASGVLLGGDKTAAYDRADVFGLFPSIGAHPLVILKALARRLPVIATGVCRILEILVNALRPTLGPGGLITELPSAITDFPAQVSLRNQVDEANHAFGLGERVRCVRHGVTR